MSAGRRAAASDKIGHRRRVRRMPSVDRHMSRDLLTVERGLPVVAVARRMVERNVGAVLVLEEGRLAGIMTERDLMRAVARGLRDDVVVGECMTANPDTIAPDDTIEHAAVLMIHGGYRHLPVVDGEDVVGVLSIRDLVQVVVEDSAPRGA
jgi:CBS domain-containing protein